MSRFNTLQIKPLPGIKRIFGANRRGTAKSGVEIHAGRLRYRLLSLASLAANDAPDGGVADRRNGEYAGSGWTHRALLVVLGVIPWWDLTCFRIFSHLKNYACRGGTFATNLKESEGDPHVGAKFARCNAPPRSIHDGRYCRKRTSLSLTRRTLFPWRCGMTKTK